MRQKMLFNIFLLTIVCQLTAEKSLSFPFYIIPKSKLMERQAFLVNKNKTQSNLKSFIETPNIPVALNEKDRMCLELCFGTPKSCHLLTIHPQSFLMWVQDVHNENEKIKVRYDPNRSSTAMINRTLIELNLDQLKTLRGYQVFDRIYTKDKFLFRGFILSVTESKYYKDEGMIGLGYRGSHFEERASFINQLYWNELIYHRVFTQYFSDNAEGVITFGEIPQEILNNYKKYGRCAALNKEIDGKIYKNRKWECEVSGIYFGDVYKEEYVHRFNNSRASFFSMRKKALVPQEIFDYFETTYFSEFIQNKICQKDTTGKYETIKCVQQIINAPKINIVYGDWVMSLPIEKLFMYKKSSESYEFMFYHKKDFENWSLGRPVVRLFHMVYDYQNQEIGFYSEKNVLYINEQSSPVPPKIYEKLPDLGEPIDDNENNDPNKVPENEENIKRRKNRKTTKDIVENIKKESGINENTMPKTFSTAFVIQNAFRVFIIIVIIVFVLFSAFLYYRHKKKEKLLNSDYFLKKANELSTKQ